MTVGTVASTGGPKGGTPSLSTESVVETVPDLAEYAAVSVKQIRQRPGFGMDFSTFAAVAERLPDTDSIDGVAFAADLSPWNARIGLLPALEAGVHPETAFTRY